MYVNIIIMSILTTSSPEALIKLDDSKYYNVSWFDIEKMKSEKGIFNINQDDGKEQHGVGGKVAHGNGTSKPAGLYLAPGRSWIDFAYKAKRTEMFYKRYLYEVTLGENLLDKIININSHDDASNFADEYGININGIINGINWTGVALKFKGINIHNWSESEDDKLKWYNEFESSQLVVWNSDAGDITYILVADATKNSNVYLKGGKKSKRNRKSSRKKKRTNRKSSRKKKRTKRNTFRKARCYHR